MIKNNNATMKEYLLKINIFKLLKLFFLISFVLFLLMDLASAVQYNQQRLLQNDSKTTRIHAFIFRDYSLFMKDFIKGDNPLELYIQYDMYINSWNQKNPSYKVDNCNYLIRYNSNLNNGTQVLLNDTYDENDADFFRRQYFVKLAERESILVDIDCEFEGNRSIDTPADFIVVTPTWECKECQWYEWSLLERDIIKAEVVGENTVDVMNYIKELFIINFEIIVTLFWFFLIIVALIPFSLIFISVYWLYTYLRKITQ